MDRPHRGPAGHALASGPPMTADSPGPAKIIEARDLFLSFGETPASSFGQTGPFSPRQIAISVRERDELGATVVRMVQFATEVEPFESILARFYGEEVNA